MEESPKVRLATSTWISLIGMIFAIAVALAGLASFVFHTEAAAQAHIGDFKHHVGSAEAKREKIEDDVDDLEDELKIQRQAFRTLNDNITELMRRQGVGRRAKPMPEEIDEEIIP